MAAEVNVAELERLSGDGVEFNARDISSGTSVAASSLDTCTGKMALPVGFVVDVKLYSARWLLAFLACVRTGV